MRFPSLNPELVPIALGAIKAVATAREPLHPTQRSMLSVAQKVMLGVELDLDAIACVSPEEMGRAGRGLPGAERVVRAMVLACLARGAVTEEDAALVATYANALGVELHVVQNLEQLAEGQLTLLRLDVQRRAFTGQSVARAVENDGFMSLVRGIASRAGVYEDDAATAKFEALAHSPEGSLGKALFHYFARNQFPLPGRKHALPAFAVVHDLCHVLSGYGVDGPGEVEVVAFQAGFMKTDPMSTLFFIVLQAHFNVPLVKIAPGSDRMLDDPALLERAIRAYHRGTGVIRDLFDGWDFWPDLERPLEDVRAEFGVVPRD